MLTVEHLEEALAKAYECKSQPGWSQQRLHSERSREWVKCLADELRKLNSDPDVCVFWKGNEKNRREFGLNELLYDVTVCKTKKDGKGPRYVTKALWQVESEFAPRTAEAVKDFNKLVLGSAENKLFIAPRVSAVRQEAYLNALLRVARCCGSRNVYLAMVPHPSKWNAERGLITMWQLANSGWQRI
jgi:hypothetical protein